MRWGWKVRGRPRSRAVVLYGKPDCGLCREAREMLDRLGHHYRLTIQEIDITTDDALYERYQTTIPVVVIDDRITLGARFDEADLRWALEEAGRSA